MAEKKDMLVPPKEVTTQPLPDKDRENITFKARRGSVFQPGKTFVAIEKKIGNKS